MVHILLIYRLYEEINSVNRPVLLSRSEQLDSEANLLDLQWKMYRRERSLSRLAVIDESNNKEVRLTVSIGQS